jgi:hypothetical protein
MDISKIPTKHASPRPGAYIPSQKFDVGHTPDCVYLLVLKGTGADVGQTRVSLVMPTRADGVGMKQVNLPTRLPTRSDGLAYEVDMKQVNPLQVYYALSEIAQEPVVEPAVVSEREHRAPASPQRPQPKKQEPTRARVAIPQILTVQPKMVHRIESATAKAETDVREAMKTAGVEPPEQNIIDMPAAKVYEYLQARVGTLTYQGKEILVGELLQMMQDPEVLYEMLVESQK